MKILFLTDNFPPEVNAPATRTYEHAVEWIKLGAEVTIITCFPNFPKGEVYEGYSNKIKQVEYIDRIKVVRVWSYITENSGFIKRTLDYFSFAVMASIFGIFEKSDIIIATSPQFFTTWGGWFLSKIKRKPWVFELRDLWPESISSVGAISSDSVVYKLLEWIELNLYKSANLVIPNTEAFKKNLINRSIPAKKIHVIPNGSNLELFRKNGNGHNLKKKLGIKSSKVVGYVGTHGLAHGLDFIIQAIHDYKISECHFLFIGDGAKKKEAVRLSKDLNIKNITFLDPIPKDIIPKYLSLVDISLVPLKKLDTFLSVIPSKIFESAAMGIPVLLGVQGQAQMIIEDYEAGLCFEPENADNFVTQLNLLLSDDQLYESLSSNALKLAKNYDRKLLAEKMLRVLSNIHSY